MCEQQRPRQACTTMKFGLDLLRFLSWILKQPKICNEKEIKALLCAYMLSAFFLLHIILVQFFNKAPFQPKKIKKFSYFSMKIYVVGTH